MMKFELFYVVLISSALIRGNILRDIILQTSNSIIRTFLNVVTDDCNLIKSIGVWSHDNYAKYVIEKLKDIHLILVTETTLETFYLNNTAEKIWNSTNYDRDLSTVIFIHGFLDSGYNMEHLKLARDIKSVDRKNVLLIEYSALVWENYFTVTTNIIYVAKVLGPILIDLYYLGVPEFYLIGHSLGAHICGIIGKIFEEQTGEKIQRITALDPAGPCYIKESPELKLTRTDADFVDVIHTNSGILGLQEPIGHVDFYPNGGVNMPGAYVAIMNHIRSHDYFLKSIKYTNFTAEVCPDYTTFLNGECYKNPKALMGYWLPSNTTNGKYYLQTAGSPTYTRGSNKIV